MFSKKRLYLAMGSKRPWLRWIDLWEDPELGWSGNKGLGYSLYAFGQIFKSEAPLRRSNPEIWAGRCSFFEKQKVYLS